jgi:GT2 family glycosyltransferase
MSEVSVIIPTWNMRERLERCLQALQAQTHPADQVIVVDNHSTDDTAQTVAARYPWVDLVRLPENRGTAGGVNAGVRAACGDVLTTLDSDAYPQPGWLAALLEAMAAHPDYAFFACKLLLADGSGRIDSAGDGFDPRFGGVMLGHLEPDGPAFSQPREVFSATGAASAYRRLVFQAAGELDESLFIYGDDIDLGFRARLLGFRCLYTPGAVVFHERSAAFGRGSAAQLRLVYRNGLTVYLKNMPWGIFHSLWPQTLRRWVGALRHAPHRDAAMRGLAEGLARLPDTLRKRRAVQAQRLVNLETLRAAMLP